MKIIKERCLVLFILIPFLLLSIFLFYFVSAVQLPNSKSDILKGNSENKITLSGNLEHIHFDDFENRISKEDYFLTFDNKRIHLYFMNDPGVLAWTKVRIRGFPRNNEFVVDSIENIASEALVTTVITPTQIQTKKVAIIMFNFLNDQSQPATSTQIRDIVFTGNNSVKEYYNETSFGQLILEGKLSSDGDIFGWYTIPYNNTRCDTYHWGIAARNAAESDGVNLSDYTNIIHVFPRTSTCSFGGSATINGQYSYINGLLGMNPQQKYGHELGHNFGAYHSSAYKCYDSNNQPVAISDNCTLYEYGDYFEIMGVAYRHMNNYHKGQLSWLGNNNVMDVSTSGIYSLAPIEIELNYTQVLRIPRKTENGQISEYYYLEYRQPYGFDSFSPTDPVSNGIIIRLAPPYSTAGKSYLIDTTPNTSWSSNGNIDDEPLLVGNVFQDNLRGIIISTLNVSSDSAIVNITIGCIHSNPALSIRPSSQNGYAGQTLVYSITLINNDNQLCLPFIFSITPTLPNGWSQFPNLFNISLSPEESITFNVNITSSIDSSIGIYTFNESVFNEIEPIYTAVSSADYNVQAIDNTPPLITILNPQNNSILPPNGNVIISANATDSSGINNIKIFINDDLKKTCSFTTTCQYNWKMSKGLSGKYIIKVNATDNSLQLNVGSSSIIVTKK